MANYRNLPSLLIFLLATATSSLAQDHLSIVSPHWEGIRYEFGNAFERYYLERQKRTVDITWIDVGGTSEILQYLFSEFRRSPDGIDIDVLFGGGTDPFVQLKRGGLLESYTPSEKVLNGVASEAAGIALHDPQGYFHSPVMASFGFMCNLAVLEKLNLPNPTSWSELTDSSFRSWIGSADPRRSGSVHMAYEVLLQSYGWQAGWDLIYRLSANTRSYVATAAQLGHDIASGEVACGFSIDSHATAQMRELGPGKISFTVPHDTPVANGDGVAILRGTKNQPTARAFIDFLLSEDAQKIWYLKVGKPGGPLKYQISRLPVRPSIYSLAKDSEVTVNPFTWATRFNYDAELGAKRWRIVNDLFSASVIDQASRLQANRDHPRKAPISEEEMQQLRNLSPADYSKVRGKLIAEWRGSSDWISVLYRLVPLILLGVIYVGSRWISRWGKVPSTIAFND